MKIQNLREFRRGEPGHRFGESLERYIRQLYLGGCPDCGTPMDCKCPEILSSSIGRIGAKAPKTMVLFPGENFLAPSALRKLVEDRSSSVFTVGQSSLPLITVHSDVWTAVGVLLRQAERGDVAMRAVIGDLQSIRDELANILISQEGSERCWRRSRKSLRACPRTIAPWRRTRWSTCCPTPFRIR